MLEQRQDDMAAGRMPITSLEQHARSLARKIINSLSASLTVTGTVAAQIVSGKGGPTMSHTVSFLNHGAYTSALLRYLDRPHGQHDCAVDGELVMRPDGSATMHGRATDYVLRGTKLWTTAYMYSDNPQLQTSPGEHNGAPGGAPRVCTTAHDRPAPTGHEECSISPPSEPRIEFSPWVCSAMYNKVQRKIVGIGSAIPFERGHPQWDTHCLVLHRHPRLPCFTAPTPMRPNEDGTEEAKERYAAFALAVFRDHRLVRRDVGLWKQLLDWEATSRKIPLSPLGMYARDCCRILQQNHTRMTAMAYSKTNAKEDAARSLLLRREVARNAGEELTVDDETCVFTHGWTGGNSAGGLATGEAFMENPGDLLAGVEEDDQQGAHASAAAIYARDALGDLLDVGMGNATGTTEPGPGIVVVATRQQQDQLSMLGKRLKDARPVLDGTQAVMLAGIDGGSDDEYDPQPPQQYRSDGRRYELRATTEVLQMGYWIWTGDTSVASPAATSPDFSWEGKPVYQRLSYPPSIVDTILLFHLSDDQALPFAVWAEFLMAKVRGKPPQPLGKLRNTTHSYTLPVRY